MVQKLVKYTGESSGMGDMGAWNRFFVSACMVVGALWSADAMAAPTAQARRAVSPPPVLIVYFVPTDRKPIPGYTGRIERTLEEVRRFYRTGMEENGYGPMTFRLDRDEKHRLRVHMVKARGPMAEYGRNSAGKVRREVKEALATKGIDIDRSYVAIFQLLLAWQNGKAREIGPFCGGGNHLHGTGWFYDDAKLDPRLMTSTAPGGYYNRPCTLGEFNSHYIGGVAHELGHAFGLPHVRETRERRQRSGHALMGSGNHSYGKDQRTGKRSDGTFLAPASAMLLSHCRAFAGDLPNAERKPVCSIETLEADFRDGKLTLSGTIRSDIPAFGIAAYNDNEKIKADYDAVGWTCAVDGKGRFHLVVSEFQPGRFELRLLVCHVNGAKTRFRFPYSVDSKRVPDVMVFRYTLPLHQAVAAFAEGDRARAEKLARSVARRFSGVDIVRRKAEHLLALLHPGKPVDAARVSAKVRSLSLADAIWAKARTGWGQPLRDQVLAEGGGTCFLEVGDEFYEHGLFAHAPSRYSFDLKGRWTTLKTGFGLQNGHRGSVVFVIRCDGKEKFRSPTITGPGLHTQSLNIRGVNKLELVVENGGDNNRDDWGVWIKPEIRR